MKQLIIWLTMMVWAITAQRQNFVQVSKTNPHYFATADGKT
ncbi:hypothetical protein [Spirosoma foliorum]|nr:hypothetical protein [Spirosoma foliorum]